MGQIYSVLGKEMKAFVRMAKLFDDKMDKFGHTLRAGRFCPLAASKMLEFASKSLRLSPSNDAKPSPS